MPHIMMGQGIFFNASPDSGNDPDNGVYNGRLHGGNHGAGYLNFENAGGGQFFITEDRDSRYLANMSVSSDGTYNFTGASAESIYHNLDRIIYSTWHFDYLEHMPNNSGSADVTFSAYDISINGGKNSYNIPYMDSSAYTVHTFSSALSADPLVTIKNATYPTLGTCLFIRYGNHSYRHIFPVADTNKIYLREVVYVSDASVPSLTINSIDFNTINTGVSVAGGVNYPNTQHSSGSEVLSITPSRVIIGDQYNASKRLFDSDKNYLKKDSSGNVEFYKISSMGMTTGTEEPLWTGASATSAQMEDFQCVIYLNKNSTMVYSENSNSTAQLTHVFSTGNDTLFGTFQGTTIKYEV